MLKKNNLPTDALDQVKTYLLALQSQILASLRSFEKKKDFIEDRWQGPIGSGLSCIVSEGSVFAKAGVNFSHVSGENLPLCATARQAELAARHFTALGVSVVVHPENPYVPTTHANVRFFIAERAGEPAIWWFGGGFDLSPYYGFLEDCQHWHRTAKKACQAFGPELYPQFKKNCDAYFFIKHRNEARGIGGLFFDDYNALHFEHSFAVMKSIGNHFIEAYAPIVSRRHNHPFGQREKNFQNYRRGRYVEYNLIYDRGTLFGLQSGGRVESILMSLPPQVHWLYNWQPEEGSDEARLYTDYLPVRDWV